MFSCLFPALGNMRKPISAKKYHVIGNTRDWLVVQLLAFLSPIAKIRKTFLRNWGIPTLKAFKYYSSHFNYKIWLKLLSKTICWRLTPPAEGGGLVPPPRTVFSRCSGTVCDGELKFSMTDPPLKPDLMIFFSFFGQVRSLTCDVISKPPHGHKILQLRNAANERQCFLRKMKLSERNKPRVLTFCISRIFHAAHQPSGQWRNLTHYKSMRGRGTETAHFGT